MPTLLLLRHAKSSWDDPDLDDFDRPLNDRGRRDAPRMGEWLNESPYKPGLVLSSSSKRTRETWALLSDELDHPPSPGFEEGLYHASAPTIIGAARRLPEEIDTAMIIGHNPGLGRAMNELAGTGPGRLRRRMASKVPTCALAVLRWDGDWEDARAGRAELVEFVRPKDLE